MKLKKAEWETQVDGIILSKLNEAHRLVKAAMESPNPSLSRLAAIELSDAGGMILMRGSTGHINEREYVFLIDKYGDPDLIHAPVASKTTRDKRRNMSKWKMTSCHDCGITCEDDLEE